MSNVNTGIKKHPLGLRLAYICTALQGFTAFAFLSFLVLFLTKSISQGGLGLSVPTATFYVGLYSGLGYFAPIIGGWITDRFLGLRKGILIGSFVGGIGYIVLFFSRATVGSLWIGLTIIIISAGFFKGNLSALVGELYSKDELTLKDAAYSIFYMGTNIGSFLGPIIAGLVSDKWFAKINASGEVVRYGYVNVFLISGVLLFITFFIFLIFSPKCLKEIGKKPATKSYLSKNKKGSQKEALTKIEKNRIFAMCIFFVFVMVYFTAWDQTQSSLSLLTEKLVNTKVGGFNIPVPWLASFNGLLCVIFAPILATFWVKLSKSKKGDLSIPTKMGFGMLLAGFAFIVLIIGVKSLGGVLDGTAKMSLLFVLLAYLLLTFGELCLSPVGMSVFNKLAPHKFSSLSMGAWYLCFFFADLISGKMAGFTASWGFSQVFGVIAVVVIVCGLILIAIKGKLVKLMALEKYEEEKESKAV